MSFDARRLYQNSALLLLAASALPLLAQSWSPQTSDLLFTSNRDGNSEIYLLEAGGAQWINLTNNPAADNWAEWSPDGKRIVFQSRRSGNLDLWRMDADGSNLLQLTDDPESDYLPTWLPKDEKLFFASWRQASEDEERANHSYVMSADGSAQQRFLDESPGTSAGIAVSKRGDRLILTRAVKVEGEGEGEREDGADLYLADAGGKVLEPLTEDGKKGVYNGSPDFSPDGKRIAFYSTRGEVSQIVVLDLESHQSKIVVAEGQNWYPRFSPDGKWLLYTAQGRGEDDLDIYAVEIDGGTPIPMVASPGKEMEGRWRPVACGCKQRNAP